MDEEYETFVRLKRKSFEEIMCLISGKTPEDGFYQWTMGDIATFEHVTPTKEFWEEHGKGWSWDEFRAECKRRTGK